MSRLPGLLPVLLPGLLPGRLSQPTPCPPGGIPPLIIRFPGDGLVITIPRSILFCRNSLLPPCPISYEGTRWLWVTSRVLLR
jgi:hypothetical protein